MRSIIILAGLLALPCGATTFYVTVAGLGGEPEYEQRFTNWAKDIDKIVRASGDAKVETLYGPAATRAKLEAVLREIGGQAKAEDALVLTLIGHGTFDGADYKINLPGPDISALELASLLDRVAARQLVVNMTSASGASLSALQRDNRVVITATKAGSEKNATIFARYWVEALRDPNADVDKNETITALEAYRYADQKTVQFYEKQTRLATEHAMMEDTAKGEAVRAPSADNGQGLLAGRFNLVRIGGAQSPMRDPAKQALLRKKEDLEQQIDALKYKKAAMPTEVYQTQLRALLLDLAKTQGEIDK